MVLYILRDKKEWGSKTRIGFLPSMIAKAIICLNNNGTKLCFGRRSSQPPRQMIDFAVQIQWNWRFLFLSTFWWQNTAFLIRLRENLIIIQISTKPSGSKLIFYLIFLKRGIRDSSVMLNLWPSPPQIYMNMRKSIPRHKLVKSEN